MTVKFEPSRTFWCLLVTLAVPVMVLTGTASVALEPEGGLLVGDPLTRAVYILFDGQKRLIPDTSTLEVLGFSLNDVQWSAAKDILAKAALGPNLLPMRVGDLIRDEETGAIYLLNHGKWAVSSEIIDACGWRNRLVRSVPSSLVEVIPEKGPLPDLQPGDLVRSREDDCLYLLAAGRYWLPSRSILDAAGWREKDIRDLDTWVISLIPEAGVIPSLHFGCLLRSSDPEDQRIYILDKGKHLIPDQATFQAYGWQESRVWKLPAEVLEVIPEGAPLEPARKGENPFMYQHWGQCTWYVAERRLVPSHRSARFWYADAQANGFAVGQRPMAGAIIVYGSEGGHGYYGHVAYVETAYADGSFALADSNICGWECVRTRLTDLSREVGVLGFVYWKYALP